MASVKYTPFKPSIGEKSRQGTEGRDEDMLYDDDWQQQSISTAPTTSVGNKRLAHIFSILLFLCSGVFAITGFRQRWSGGNNGSRSIHDEGYERIYSPAWEAVEYQRKVFYSDVEGSAKYMGKPRPEWDEAWEDITAGHFIKLNETGIRRLGQPVTKTVNKGGQYFAVLEYYHQMHCLDIIRRYLWRDYYPDFRVFQGPDEEVWEHVDHCLQLMRQVIMCNVDVGMIIYHWEGPGRDPKADIATKHVCRNLDKIQEWVSENMWTAEETFDPVENKIDMPSLMHRLLKA